MKKKNIFKGTIIAVSAALIAAVGVSAFALAAPKAADNVSAAISSEEESGIKEMTLAGKKVIVGQTTVQELVDDGWETDICLENKNEYDCGFTAGGTITYGEESFDICFSMDVGQTYAEGVLCEVDTGESESCAPEMGDKTYLGDTEVIMGETTMRELKDAGWKFSMSDAEMNEINNDYDCFCSGFSVTVSKGLRRYTIIDMAEAGEAWIDGVLWEIE